MKTLITGGTVVSSNGSKQCDILIENGVVRQVGDCSGINPDRVIDACNRLVFPGFIDAHTHFDLDVCNTTTADDFYSGGISAICGGTTTIIDFACPNKGESLDFGLKKWHEKAEKNGCACDYGFHMTIDDWNPGICSELPAMFDHGISSFKMYMTYPAMMIDDDDMLSALKELNKLGGISGVHCEDSALIDQLISEEKKKGLTMPQSHPQARPAIAEAEAVSHLLDMAGLVNTPITIVHLSAAESLERVRNARKRGQTVFVETCPQYLVLDDSNYYKPAFEGAKYVCAPPLRKQSDIDSLWKAIAQGEIQTVSTDHCSFTLAQKDAGKGDFTKIPGGLPGVETRGLLLFSEGVVKNKITLSDMCRVLCENPARLYGLFPRKGIIDVGSDADIVILNPAEKRTLSVTNLHGKADYSPYEGMEISGSIEKVILRGETVFENNRILHDKQGVYLERDRYKMPI